MLYCNMIENVVIRNYDFKRVYAKLNTYLFQLYLYFTLD